MTDFDSLIVECQELAESIWPCDGVAVEVRQGAAEVVAYRMRSDDDRADAFRRFFDERSTMAALRELHASLTEERDGLDEDALQAKLAATARDLVNARSAFNSTVEKLDRAHADAATMRARLGEFERKELAAIQAAQKAASTTKRKRAGK